MPREGAVLVDGTVGAGGHAVALAAGLGAGGRLIGLDRDPAMLALAERTTRGLPVTLVHAAYSELGGVLDELGIDAVDGIVLDLGLSSDQLAWDGSRVQLRGRRAARHAVRPRCRDPTAADLVNTLGEEDLANLFFEFGEERFSRRIARRIVEARRVEPIRPRHSSPTSSAGACPAKSAGPIDPATRVFQALRIAVNDELGHLDAALEPISPTGSSPGGRAAVISFHSLEDRRVKWAFKTIRG